MELLIQTEVDLNDDAVGRSRYERFYRSPIMREKI